MTLSTLDKLFGYDPKKSEDGVPVTVGINEKGNDVIFYIAEAGNEKHEKVQRKYSKMLETTRKTPKEHDKVLARIIAESLLLKWEGMLDENGNEIEPTIEMKTECLIKYRRLRQQVMAESINESNFLPEEADKKKAEKDTEKN